MNKRTPGAVSLGAFLKEQGVTLDAAANALGTTKSAVYQWINGGQRPRGEFRDAIAKWTSGRIHRDTWMTEEERATSSDVVPFRAAGGR